ncbi:MAG: hypothetical protein R3F48_16145 [Candidatus Zixiibacteriota bacterium]
MGEISMKSGAILRTLYLLGLISMLLLTACSEKIINDSADTIIIETSFKPGMSSGLTGFVLTVSASDMRTITTTLNLRDGYLVGQVSVPPGRNRLFRIEALDETDRVIYRGESTIDIARGTPVELSITMQPVTPSLSMTPHFSEATMGDNAAFDIYAWNIPDMYNLSFFINIGDPENLLLYDSVHVGGNLSGSPSVNITDNTNSLLASIGRLDAVLPFVDSVGDGHLMRVFFHSHYDTQLNIDTISLSLQVAAMAFSQASTLTADSVFVDQATIILSKDSTTGEPTTGPAWVRTYTKEGDDWGNAVAVAQNGNIIAVGQHNVSGSDWNATIIAVDSNGVYVNDESIGASGNDIAADIVSAGITNWMTGWTTTADEGENVLLAELDNGGGLIRQVDFGGSGNQRANGIIAASTNHLYLVGRTGANTSDVLIIKTDAVGDTVWTRTYDFNPYDEGFAAAEAANGDIVIAGATGLYINDILVMRINSDGQLLWDTTLGGAQIDWAGAIATTQDNGFIVCGYTYSMGLGSGDTYLAKFSADNIFLWQTTLGTPTHEHGNDIIATSDGNFVIAGLAGSLTSGKSTATITKVNSSGQVVWQRAYSGGNNNEAFGVSETAGGSYIITGSLESSTANDFDTFILKMSSDGNWQ